MSNQVDDIYIKAFNQAYLISKYNMTLIEKVLQSQNSGIYFQGLQDGKQTFEKEKGIKRMRELRKVKSKDLDKGDNRERDV